MKKYCINFFYGSGEVQSVKSTPPELIKSLKRQPSKYKNISDFFKWKLQV